MPLEQRHAWGRAYRDDEIVCARVQVTIERDERLGLAGRRTVLACFQERVDGTLYAELTELVRRRRGAAACRVAESMAPVVLVLDSGAEGRQRIGVREPHRS
jgi:hypothetical protein